LQIKYGYDIVNRLLNFVFFMGVPKQRHTKSRRNKRRLNIFLSRSVLTLCPKCGKRKLPHAICWNCGYYKERMAIDVLAKLTKKEKKKREKEMAQKDKEEKSARPLTMEELSKR